MSKIWFFVEGFSEENFVRKILENHYWKNFQLEKDLSRFVNNQSSSKNICYCVNCKNVERIPYEINEKYYQVERSKSNHIFIICDVEKLGCYTARKQIIEKKLKSDVNKNIIKYIFSNPYIEIHYWECLNLLKRIIRKQLLIIKTRKNFSITIPNSLPRTQDGLKAVFKRNGVNFRKKYISENFFATINYSSCQNTVLRRFINYFDSI